MYVKLDIVSTLILACAGYAALHLFLLLFKPSRRAYPPGPTPWPLVGNIADLPPKGEREWEFWLPHKDKYGPISSITVLGTTMVMLHSLELAFELMERRSSIYSSRPQMIFGGELCGWDHALAMLPYNAQLRAFRKPMHAAVGTKTGTSQFNHLQEVEVHRFLLRVLKNPSDLRDHIRTQAGAIILKLAYGYTIEPHQRDPLVDIADRALEQFSAAAVAGAWLVDTVPALKHLPPWIPGAGFKKTAKVWKATLMELAERPMQFVQKQMADNNYTDSYVSKLLDKSNGKLSVDEYQVVKWSAASLYTGGADTSVSAISTFFLAMTLHPELQRQAQEEIDRVVGSDRLPNFNDRGSLPYIEALVKESLRWHTLAPLGLPHLTTADDICEGYTIPKGAIILFNTWWFSHDPSVYPKPDEFDPSRFLGPNPAPDPSQYVFGFGRRICPGKQLADSSVWLTLARSLAVFDISKGLDKTTGEEIEPDVRFTPGVISHPEPFLAQVTPRSSRHEELIRTVEDLHPWEESSARELRRVDVQ